MYIPPRQAPKASAQTRGLRERQSFSELASSIMTGMVAVVKGMLSIKEEAKAEIHSTITMATSIWCSGLTLWTQEKKTQFFKGES